MERRVALTVWALTAPSSSACPYARLAQRAGFQRAEAAHSAIAHKGTIGAAPLAGASVLQLGEHPVEA